MKVFQTLIEFGDRKRGQTTEFADRYFSKVCAAPLSYASKDPF